MPNALDELPNAVGSADAAWVRAIAEENQHQHSALTGALTTQLDLMLPQIAEKHRQSPLSREERLTLLALVDCGANTRHLDHPTHQFIEAMRHDHSHAHGYTRGNQQRAGRYRY